MKSLKSVIHELVPNLSVNQKNWIVYFQQHPDLKKFFLENDIDDNHILASLNLLNQYIEEKGNCRQCNDLTNCSNILSGHYSEIYLENGQFQSKLVKCNKKRYKEENDYRQKLFHSLYIPNEILDASFKDIEQNTMGKENLLALKTLIQFVNDYRTNKNPKGIYLYGPLGVGKSYMMSAVANKLAINGVSVLMVYVPDFFREIKNSIKDSTIEEKIEALKKVEVLILDDIGAETISQWERDEILGAILQARMIKSMPTLYTSNLNYDDLEEHLSYSNKGGEERLKAKRIMERIRHYTTPFLIDGPNRRMNK